MKLQLVCAMAGLAIVVSQTVASAALIDITRPGDPIEVVSGDNQNDGDAGPPPGAEGVENAINDIGQKYLNFLDLNSGLRVTPSANPGGEPVVGLRLYTANDSETRDPASFQLSGSNDSIDGPWTVIASGNLELPSGRNEGGSTVSIPPTGNLGAFHQEVSFENNTLPFDHYRLIFPTLKNAADANSMQIAEIELLAVPEPAGLTLALLSLLGIATLRRRNG
jgi:hypothetical protein